MQFYLGVDFGSQQDYSAFALVRQNQVVKVKQNGFGGISYEDIALEYQLLFLERIELGTAYHRIVDRIGGILRDEDLRGETMVVPDATGVGVPIIQMMRERGVTPMTPISIHGGMTVSPNDFGGYSVPKRDLVTALTIVVQSRRLRVASDVKYRAQLVHEMQSFTLKTTKSGNDTYEALMEKDHDDLVMALAMAIWLAERRKPASDPVAPVRRDIMA